MPIKSVEQRNLSATANISQIGILHKGGERTQQMIDNKQPGPDLDYFRIEVFARFSHLNGDIKRIYGEQPKFLDPVWVLGKTAASAFDSWREERGLGGKRVIRRCDEEQQIMWPVNDDANNVVQANYARPPIACRGGGEHGGCAICKYVGRLHIVLYDLFKETGAMGYFLLQTTSQIDVSSISGSLSRFGDLSNLERIPFRLGRELRHVGWRSYVKDGQTKTAEVRKNLVYLDLSLKISAVPVLAPGVEQQFGLPSGTVDALLDQQQKLALPSGTVVPPAADPPSPSSPSSPSSDDIVQGDFTETTDDPPFTPTNAVAQPPSKPAQAAPPKKNDPPPPATAQHWSLDEKNRKLVMETFALYNINSKGIGASLPQVEAGVARLGESKTSSVKEFIDLIHKHYSKPEQQGKWAWTPNQIAAFEKEITDAFPGVLIADVLEATGGKVWNLSPDEERKLVVAAALKERWPVTVSKVRYHQGQTKADSFFEFPSYLGGIRWFEGTNAFMAAAGEGYARANDVAHWRELKAERAIEPIILEWDEKTRQDKSTYLIVKAVKLTSNLDAVLSGTEPAIEGEIP